MLGFVGVDRGLCASCRCMVTVRGRMKFQCGVVWCAPRLSEKPARVSLIMSSCCSGKYGWKNASYRAVLVHELYCQVDAHLCEGIYRHVPSSSDCSITSKKRAEIVSVRVMPAVGSSRCWSISRSLCHDLLTGRRGISSLTRKRHLADFPDEAAGSGLL
jgi:hypothetical protein